MDNACRPSKQIVPASRLLFLLICALFFTPIAHADQNYSQQMFFENSLSPGNYFYSVGKASAPSTLTLVNGKLPIETTTFISGPNALELQWESAPQAGWEATLHLYQWRNRYVDFPGQDLYLWLYAPNGMSAKYLPNPEITSMLARVGFVPDNTRAGNEKTTNASAVSAKPH